MTKYLLDTHILLWFFFDSQKLSTPISKILQNPESALFISAISFWEISIKYESRKLQLGDFHPSDLNKMAADSRITPVDLSAETASTFYKLKASYHKDPFDRLLIWQAIKEDYLFITEDENIKLYKSEGLRLIE